MSATRVKDGEPEALGLGVEVGGRLGVDRRQDAALPEDPREGRGVELPAVLRAEVGLHARGGALAVLARGRRDVDLERALVEEEILPDLEVGEVEIDLHLRAHVEALHRDGAAHVAADVVVGEPRDLAERGLVELGEEARGVARRAAGEELVQIEGDLAVGGGDLLRAVLDVEVDRGLLGVVGGEQLAVERQRPRRGLVPGEVLRDRQAEGRGARGEEGLVDRPVDVGVGADLAAEGGEAIAREARQRHERGHLAPWDGDPPRDRRAAERGPAILGRSTRAARSSVAASEASASTSPSKRAARSVDSPLPPSTSPLICTSSLRDSYSGASAPKGCGPATSSPAVRTRDRAPRRSACRACGRRRSAPRACRARRRRRGRWARGGRGSGDPSRRRRRGPCR